MTGCVQTQDVGVPAQTSASPADTSAVDEPVWKLATFLKGELCMCTDTFTRYMNTAFMLQGREGHENMGTSIA